MINQKINWTNFETLLQEPVTQTTTAATESGIKHQMEKVHFSKPTFCAFCGEFIWGLLKQGYSCKGNSKNRYRIPSHISNSKPLFLHSHLLFHNQFNHHPIITFLISSLFLSHSQTLRRQIPCQLRFHRYQQTVRSQRPRHRRHATEPFSALS